MKKALSLFLAFVMVLLMGAVASAAVTAHSHPVCGSRCTCSSTMHSSVTWTAWDGTTTLGSGYYYLTRDIVLSETLDLKSNYTTRLCLNGHTISCGNNYISIWSLRSLTVTDCVGTGRIESTSSYAIGNSKYFYLWGGTVSGSRQAVFSGGDSSTYIYGGHVEAMNSYAFFAQDTSRVYISGGLVESVNHDAIYARDTSMISISGGTVSGNGAAIYRTPDASVTVSGGTVSGGDFGIDGQGIVDSEGNDIAGKGTVTVSGGTVSAANDASLGIQSGNLTVSGGNIEGMVWFFSGAGEKATVRGGTLSGGFQTMSGGETIISDGDITNPDFGGNTTISGGTFRSVIMNDGYFSYYPPCEFSGRSNVTITGGDFTNCNGVTFDGYTTAKISGGEFPDVTLQRTGGYNSPDTSASLYLSGQPQIEKLNIGYLCAVSARNSAGTAYYTGDPIPVKYYYSAANNEPNGWRDGDTVIKNCVSDAVAARFVLDGDTASYNSYFLQRAGSDLKFRKCWGGNIRWQLNDGVLTISGDGEIAATDFGSQYPWGSYRNEITNIIVEPGVTNIPQYAFEYCNNVQTVRLPETLASIHLSAFHDCIQLHDLLLPASLTSLSSSGTYNHFFDGCESLTDLYYPGTAEEWDTLVEGKELTKVNCTTDLTLHVLQYHPSTATCTAPGLQAYYQFDNTSVYGSMYDENKAVITRLQTVPATGHTEVNVPAQEPTCTEWGYAAWSYCSVCGDPLIEKVDIRPNGHSTEVIGAYPPTCGKDGFTGVTRCAVCKEVFDEGATIAATGNHTPGSPVERIVSQPTCTVSGKRTVTVSCTVCGKILSQNTDELYAKGHRGYQNDGVCDECGATVSNCACGKYHTGAMAGIIIFFHRILYFFRNLFR